MLKQATLLCFSLFVLLAPAALAGQRPPISAPTSEIQVNRIPTLHPEAQGLTEFVSEAARPFLQLKEVSGLAVVVVKGGDVLLARGYRKPGSDNRVELAAVQFRPGSFSELFADIAMLQLVEQGHLLLDEDVGAALGERDRGVTIADLLTRRSPVAPELSEQIVAAASGMRVHDLIRNRIFTPLAMMHSGYDRDGGVTTADDIGRLILAILNSEDYTGTRILQPATTDQMLRVQATPHAALSGYAFGFAELLRDGWRGVARDGTADTTQTRMVLIPSNATGYFIVVFGHAEPESWRALDDAIFGRLFPARSVEELAASNDPPPTKEDAQALIGDYELSKASPYDFLRVGDRTLTIGAHDGVLAVSGAERGELHAYAGGVWRSDDGNLRLAGSNGQILVDTRVYERAPNPIVFVILSALVALAGIGYAAFRIWRA